MPDTPKTAQEALAFCEANDVRFVRLWFTDLLGQLKSFSINATELEDAFEGGMGFDGSSISGFNPIEESDMIAMPDPETIQLVPWRPEDKNRTARMICARSRSKSSLKLMGICVMAVYGRLSRPSSSSPATLGSATPTGSPPQKSSAL